MWFYELPDGDGVEVMTDGALVGDDPAWLTVARPEREEAPQPRALLAPWVDETRVRDFKEPRAPHLRRRIEPEFPDWSRGIPLDKTYHELDRHPQREKIEKLYAAWEQEWLAWAERRRAIDPLVRLYDRLHKMHEDAAGLGEAYELVLGLGRLTWQTSTGQRVERHLVTHRATLQLDPSTGTLTAAPAADGIGGDPRGGARAQGHRPARVPERSGPTADPRSDAAACDDRGQRSRSRTGGGNDDARGTVCGTADRGGPPGRARRTARWSCAVVEAEPDRPEPSAGPGDPRRGFPAPVP